MSCHNRQRWQLATARAAAAAASALPLRTTCCAACDPRSPPLAPAKSLPEVTEGFASETGGRAGPSGGRLAGTPKYEIVAAFPCKTRALTSVQLY